MPRRLKRLTFQQRLGRYPPILVRLLTCWGKDCPNDQQLATACELTIAVVKRISYSLTWDGIAVPEMFRFFSGCRIDLENRRTFRRLEKMRKHGKFTRLHRSPLWQTQFEEMATLYVEHAA